MPDISFEDFDATIATETIAEPDPDRSIKHRVGTEFGDPRTTEEMIDNCNERGEMEDEIAAAICVLHNKTGSELIMTATPIGQRKGLIKNMGPDPGDSLFYFRHEDKGFDFEIPIEIKGRDRQGINFRPRVWDVDKCIRYNRPYLLVMNNNTSYTSLVFLYTPDLIQIRDTHTSMRKETKPNGAVLNPYGGKPYYRVDDFRQYDRVSFKDLHFGGSLDNWKKMIKRLYVVYIENK